MKKKQPECSSSAARLAKQAARLGYENPQIFKRDKRWFMVSLSLFNGKEQGIGSSIKEAVDVIKYQATVQGLKPIKAEKGALALRA